jgi:hypothetical protein
LPASGSPDLPGYGTSDEIDFIAPNLTHRTDIPSPPSPRVIVVSAAGAVGKTTLARQVSRAKSAPLWDLSRYQSVGAGDPIGPSSEHSQPAA